MIKNLVISSGGIILFSFLGSLKYLNEINYLENVTSFYGVSAGSILCTMLSLGYTIDEIHEFLIKFDILKFIGDNDIINLINDYGLSLGQNRDIIAQTIISYKLGEENINYTFKQLYDEKKIKLNIFATCIEDKNLWKFTYNENHDVPIWKALVASCNIPFLFSPIEINNKKFIDGAIIDTFPISYIPKNEIDNTLGIYFDKYYYYNFDLNLDNEYLNNNLNFKYYIEIFVLNIFNKYNYCYKNTIRISLPDKFKNYEFFFDINNEDKHNLINIGYKIAKNYIYLDNIKN
jgi:NTE family protein